MRIRLADTKLREELVLDFERSGFAVERDGDVVEIHRPDAPSRTQSRREIDLHYAVWRAMNPDASVEMPDG